MQLYHHFHPPLFSAGFLAHGITVSTMAVSIMKAFLGADSMEVKGQVFPLRRVATQQSGWHPRVVLFSIIALQY
jgi:hypothetical protein